MRKRKILRTILLWCGIVIASIVVIVGAVCLRYSYALNNRKDAPKRIYDSAESFEQDLNDGYDLRGVKVTLTVRGVKTKTPLGRNVWCGEHLNLYPSNDTAVAAGDTITVQVGRITRIPENSYLIVCKILDGEER